MDRILKMGVCLTLIVVLSCPAIVLAKNAGQSTIVNMTNQVYDGGAKALDKTEGILNRCLKSTFSLFKTRQFISSPFLYNPGVEAFLSRVPEIV